MSIFDAGSLPTPKAPTGDAKRYKRRAYATVQFSGENDQFSCGGGPALLMNPGSGYGSVYGRPKPYLNSVTTKNQGGGDITDVALWEIEFTYTCYTIDDLNQLSQAFMIPGNLINVKFGWNTGGEISISKARIYDFGWSYNSDGSFSCTGKALGQSSAAGAFAMTPAKTGVASADAENSTESYSIIKQLQDQCDEAFGLTREDDGTIDGGNLPSEGTGKSINGFGIATLQKEAGFIDSIISFGSADEVYVSYVQVRNIIDFLNNEVMGDGFSFVCDAKYQTLSLLKSADMMAVMLPSEGGKYGAENDFSGFEGAFGDVNDIYISTGKLLDLEKELLTKSKETRDASYTANSFLQRVLAEIDQCTGGAASCAIIPTPSNPKKYNIVNKLNDIKKNSGGTTINLLGINSPIKGINMSSNMDPEMAAIAFAGGGGTFPEGAADNIFKGCKAKPQSKRKGPSPASSVQSKIKEIGEGSWKAEGASDFKTVLRKYVLSKDTGVKSVSLRYNIDLSLTFDGLPGVAFYQKFQVTPLPAAYNGGSTYFVVGEIEHSVKEDGMWETTVVGYMMVNT